MDRVNKTASLFNGKILDVRDFSDVVYCGCKKAGTASCGYTPGLSNCVRRGEVSERPDKSQS